MPGPHPPRVRNIKAGNILVLVDSCRSVKLAAFGISADKGIPSGIQAPMSTPTVQRTKVTPAPPRP
jgi:hypothetical protein